MTDGSIEPGVAYGSAIEERESSPDQMDYLGHVRATSASRSRRRTLVAIVALLAILVFGSVLGVWRWHQYSSSPLYSLQLLESGVRAQDPVEVARYYDAKGVAGSLYEAAAADFSRNAIGEELAWLGEVIASTAEPLLVDRLASRVTETILGNPTLALQGLVPDPAVTTIERVGPKAIASTPFAEGEEIRFLMLQSGNRWRIVGIENAADVHGHLMGVVGSDISEWDWAP